MQSDGMMPQIIKKGEVAKVEYKKQRVGAMFKYEF